jgi:hypothetical protein
MSSLLPPSAERQLRNSFRAAKRLGTSLMSKAP